MLDRAHLHAALQNGSVLNADALGDYVTCQSTFAADVQTVGALNVALHFAQDDNFAGADVGGDAAVTSNGDPVLGKIDGALDSPIDVERFVPLTSPLMTTERPIVACSTGTLTVLLGLKFWFEGDCDF